MTSTNSKTSMLGQKSEAMLGGHLPFADGKILPLNIDGFDWWYRSLPIHKLFLEGGDREINYLAPDQLQPDYPFVHLNWNVDC